jgi:oligoribonuclease
MSDANPTIETPKKQKATKLLWVDLEMTGLEPRDEVITEIAALVSDFKLNIESEYEGVVHYSKEDLKARFNKEPNGFWNSMPKERDKLIKSCSESKLSLEDLEDSLIEICEKHFPKDEKIILAGNSIRVDRMFIDKYMPRFAGLLHYRMFDVTTLKIWIEGNGHQGRKKEERHRALYDIHESMAELKYYLEKGWVKL